MFRKPHEAKKGQAGFTLTEVAIVLGAVGLVLAAVWSVTSTVWNNSHGQQLQQEILTIAQNVRDYYTNKGKIYGNNANNACATDAEITDLLNSDNRRLIPIEMRADPSADNGPILHALGGELEVFCKRSGNAFQIKASGLKRENCIRLLMQFPVLTPEVGVERVKAGGLDTAINLSNVETPGTDFPMSASDANKYCDKNENEVSLDFKLRN